MESYLQLAHANNPRDSMLSAGLYLRLANMPITKQSVARFSSGAILGVGREDLGWFDSESGAHAHDSN